MQEGFGADSCRRVNRQRDPLVASNEHVGRKPPDSAYEAPVNPIEWASAGQMVQPPFISPFQQPQQHLSHIISSPFPPGGPSQIPPCSNVQSEMQPRSHMFLTNPHMTHTQPPASYYPPEQFIAPQTMGAFGANNIYGNVSTDNFQTRDLPQGVQPSLSWHGLPSKPQGKPMEPVAPSCHPVSATGPATYPVLGNQIVNYQMQQGSQFSSTSGNYLATPIVADDDNELPLLEELGIRPEDILTRMRSVLFFTSIGHDLLEDCDLTGPLVILVTLGICLLLTGKLHFGCIYGMGSFGCLSSYALMNLMAKDTTLDLYRTISILGYSLLPIDFLAIASIFVNLRTTTGGAAAVAMVLWCTVTASRFFEMALNMRKQRFLIAYPIFLLYASFLLITLY